MRIFSMCIRVCLDNGENAFHVHLCVSTSMRMFFMYICVCLGNDENVFDVYLCVFRQR